MQPEAKGGDGRDPREHGYAEGGGLWEHANIPIALTWELQNAGDGNADESFGC